MKLKFKVMFLLVLIFPSQIGWSNPPESEDGDFGTSSQPLAESW